MDEAKRKQHAAARAHVDAAMTTLMQDELWFAQNPGRAFRHRRMMSNERLYVSERTRGLERFEQDGVEDWVLVSRVPNEPNVYHHYMHTQPVGSLPFGDGDPRITALLLAAKPLRRSAQTQAQL